MRGLLIVPRTRSLACNVPSNSFPGTTASRRESGRAATSTVRSLVAGSRTPLTVTRPPPTRRAMVLVSTRAPFTRSCAGAASVIARPPWRPSRRDRSIRISPSARSTLADTAASLMGPEARSATSALSRLPFNVPVKRTISASPENRSAEIVASVAATPRGSSTTASIFSVPTANPSPLRSVPRSFV